MLINTTTFNQQYIMIYIMTRYIPLNRQNCKYFFNFFKIFFDIKRKLTTISYYFSKTNQ